MDTTNVVSDNRIEIKVSKETREVVEHLFWVFQKLPKDILLSSNDRGLSIHNSKINKTLALIESK